jgi:DNA adenine methylase
MRSFLKWAGGKYAIRQHILANLPKGKRLIEPFTGAGAIFLNSDYSQYLLGEKNRDLVDLFQFIQQEGESFIQDASQYFQPENNTAEKYAFFRDRFNQTLNQAKHKRERALLFLYLNRHGYNGLCRYNSQGGYNVPFGKYTRPLFPIEKMLNFHKKSQNAIFEQSDFRETMQKAKKDDVVYCDPPYVPLTSNFRYVPGEFSTHDQIELAKLAEKLAGKNIPVIISNHDTPETREYYKNAKIIEFSVYRPISCKINHRQKAKELIAVFGI